jgi:hypothetical protein
MQYPLLPTMLRLLPAGLLMLASTLLFLSCEKEEDIPAFATLDLANQDIVFVMEEEQTVLATVTGTGGNDNSGRSNT